MCDVRQHSAEAGPYFLHPARTRELRNEWASVLRDSMARVQQLQRPPIHHASKISNQQTLKRRAGWRQGSKERGARLEFHVVRGTEDVVGRGNVQIQYRLSDLDESRTK